MQRTLFVCSAILSLAVAPIASGATVFLDDFNKGSTPLIGTTPNTGGVWTNVSSTSNPIQIVSNQVAMGAAGGEDAMSLTDGFVAPDVGNVIHTALDINVSSAATGDYFAHLGDGGTSAFYQRLFVQAATGGYVLGILETSGGANTPTYGTTVLPFGQMQHVDINWTPVAGPTNDTFAVLVNSLPYVTKAWTSPTAEPALIKSAHLRQGGAASSAALTVDNYTVDAPNVVPEPTSVGLMLLGLAMALVKRSR